MNADQPFSLADLDYHLPEALIAQHPPARRDDARMLIVDRRIGEIRDSSIPEFTGCVQAGDLLVLNDTRVLPARFSARRATGGRIEGLFLEEASPGLWRVMLERSRRLKVGETLNLAGAGPEVPVVLEQRLDEGEWLIRVPGEESAERILTRLGRTPLPPYIRRTGPEPQSEPEDRERYQTVYARRLGAIAAPTAGLHLTNEILAALREKKVEIAHVTLHVGAGTFKPIAAQSLAGHVMHSERYEVPEETTAAWESCRQRGGRVVAIGTTVVRVLETVLAGDKRPASTASGTTNLFLHPPYRFRAVDCLLTNFHLPRSTLLALVMAFAGVELTKRAYRHAIDHQYRFYSYGDAMWIE